MVKRSSLSVVPKKTMHKRDIVLGCCVFVWWAVCRGVFVNEALGRAVLPPVCCAALTLLPVEGRGVEQRVGGGRGAVAG